MILMKFTDNGDVFGIIDRTGISSNVREPSYYYKIVKIMNG